MHRQLCDYLTDLFQNALEAGAGHVGLTLDQDEGFFHVDLSDDGKGMDEDQLVRAQDPFYSDGEKHAHRKVGLGLPLVVQTIEMTGGRFQISSEPGVGTRVQASFNLNHWDTPPLGDLGQTLGLLMAWEGDWEASFHRRLTAGGRCAEYRVLRSDLRDALGDLDDLESRTLLREFFRSREEALQRGENPS